MMSDRTAVQEKPKTAAAKEGCGAGTQEKAYLLSATWFRKGNGAARYREYLEQASPIAERYGARRVEGLMPVETLRGHFDPDYVSVVAWPSIENYYEFLKDIHYRAVAILREEAVAKSVVIHCRRIGD